MANQNDYAELQEEEFESSFNLDDLESKLYADLENDLKDLDILNNQKDSLENPDALGDVIKNIIWEQFQTQIGVKTGQDFIAENHGNTLDLRSSAHIQTAENFAKGKIATHNDKIDFQKRYGNWQAKFQKDERGNVKTKYDPRSGKELPVLNKDAREAFDRNRAKGSVFIHEDHTIPIAEQVRDSEANAYMSEEEQNNFANSDVNLHDLDAAANQSKGDSSMTDWLDSERDGKRPAERFNIDEAECRKNDKEAREEWNKQKMKGKQKAIKTGRQSQKEEAFRIGKSAMRTVLLQLLAELVKEIVSKLIQWFKSKSKKLKSLIGSLKEAIHSFINDLKNKLIRVGNSVVTTIATAIFGPIISTLKKLWIFLKQGWSSVKQAIDYLRSPEVKQKPFGLVMLEVGKIIIAVLTAGGAIILSEVIEKGLLSIPVFAIEIPLLGSIANVLGIFLGSVVSGIIGAIVLDLINKLIAKKQKQEIVTAKITKNHDILNKQNQIVTIGELKSQQIKASTGIAIQQLHKEANTIMKDIIDEISKNESHQDNYTTLEAMRKKLEGLGDK